MDPQMAEDLAIILIYVFSPTWKIGTLFFLWRIARHLKKISRVVESTTIPAVEVENGP